MSKFFEFVGYVATVLATVFGIFYLIDKLTDKEIDEELCEEEGDAEEFECELHEIEDEDEAAVPLAE